MLSPAAFFNNKNNMENLESHHANDNMIIYEGNI